MINSTDLGANVKEDFGYIISSIFVVFIMIIIKSYAENFFLL